MATIKTVYFVHHSHTDIGYTDLQENIISRQIEYIRNAIDIMKSPKEQAFRWNCETYYCVEKFIEQATEAEKNAFFALVKENKIGFSASYLNFTDLVDSMILKKRMNEMTERLSKQNIPVKTAMIADINGISMGQRDAMLNVGVEFLFTNIHTHHGMYPLYQNQNAYWWEAKNGKRLLIWNGEHYNLGNMLGFAPRGVGKLNDNPYPAEDAKAYYHRLKNYLTDCEEHDYPYDFIISGISGVFSDNAPPNTDVLRLIETCNEFDSELQLQMVSLQELYEILQKKLSLDTLPVYQGDLTDWWANGIGSAPYAAKHYRSAQKMYHLAGKLNPDIYQKQPELTRIAEDNFLLYSEHTYGHSSTIIDPYDTMVLNLDIRKTSYASKAHEASAMLLEETKKELGSKSSYYDSSGTLKAICPGKTSGIYPVEFYLETAPGLTYKVSQTDSGKEMQVQISDHPRGFLISFTDEFQAGETNTYYYEGFPVIIADLNTRFEVKNPTSRFAYVGAESVRDIVNDYDSETYQTPYQIENQWFKIGYQIGIGFTSFYNKKDNIEMLSDGIDKFFTPIYERTKIRTDNYTERRIIGRNIRGQHAVQYQGNLIGVRCLDNGNVFTRTEFQFDLEGTQECFVLVKAYKDVPRIDISLRMAKDLSNDIESVYLPLTLQGKNQSLYFNKGKEPFRPGIDQIPGTCMEYWVSDQGAVYCNETSSILIHTLDVPLLYMGEAQHHPIQLCDNQPKNNQRPLYSWVMNNTWETNFKMDLSGYAEFCYRVELSDQTNPEACFAQLNDSALDIYPYLAE